MKLFSTAGFLLVAAISGCHISANFSKPLATNSPLAYAGDLSLRDKDQSTKSGEYVLKVTFLVDLDLPALQKDQEGTAKLVHVQQVIQDGKIYPDYTASWNNYSLLACGIQYATTEKDLSFVVQHGDSVVFDISTVETGFKNPDDSATIDEVSLTNSSPQITSSGGVESISCKGKPGTLTAAEMIRTFGKDENGNPRASAVIMLKSDYENQLKALPTATPTVAGS